MKAKTFGFFSLQFPQKDLLSVIWNPWKDNEIISTNLILSQVLIAQKEASIKLLIGNTKTIIITPKKTENTLKLTTLKRNPTKDKLLLQSQEIKFST